MPSRKWRGSRHFFFSFFFFVLHICTRSTEPEILKFWNQAPISSSIDRSFSQILFLFAICPRSRQRERKRPKLTGRQRTRSSSGKTTDRCWDIKSWPRRKDTKGGDVRPFSRAGSPLASFVWLLMNSLIGSVRLPAKNRLPEQGCHVFGFYFPWLTLSICKYVRPVPPRVLFRVSPFRARLRSRARARACMYGMYVWKCVLSRAPATRECAWSRVFTRQSRSVLVARPDSL